MSSFPKNVSISLGKWEFLDSICNKTHAHTSHLKIPPGAKQIINYRSDREIFEFSIIYKYVSTNPEYLYTGHITRVILRWFIFRVLQATKQASF